MRGVVESLLGDERIPFNTRAKDTSPRLRREKATDLLTWDWEDDGEVHSENERRRCLQSD